MHKLTGSKTFRFNHLVLESSSRVAEHPLIESALGHLDLHSPRSLWRLENQMLVQAHPDVGDVAAALVVDADVEEDCLAGHEAAPRDRKGGDYGLLLALDHIAAKLFGHGVADAGEQGAVEIQVEQMVHKEFLLRL